MPRANEFTPLLVSDGDDTIAFRPRQRRSVWQLVLAGALSLGVLSLFQQKESDSVPVEIVDVTVSFDKDTSDAEFLSSMETFKDPAVDPCVDFYQYACGGWLQQHEIPSDRPAIDSSFYIVSESNKDTIRRIFDQNPPQIGPFYQSCLSGQEVDAEAVAFVAQLIESVHQANSTLALMTVAGEVDQSLGISSFFSWGVGADPQDPSNNVLQFAQGGLTLPSREYYLQEDKVDAYATLFADYVTQLFAVGDLDRHNVSEFAEAVLETETKFAEISLPNAALRDPWTTSTAFPFAEIAQKYPFLMAYLNGIYKQEPFPMLEAIIATPTFFDAQNELLRDESLLPQLKNYLSFHLIDSFGAVLGEYFRRASHEFHGKIQGAGALLPRDQFCVRLTTTFLGEELGEYYMKDVFGPDAKTAAQTLVAEIEESLKALLMTESWLDKVTYEAAVAKLDKVKNFIGGPDDVEPLPFELQADAFFNNVKRLMELSAAAAIETIDKPVDKQAWDMFPSTVNAYYDPSANKMVFPAAILQPPFYSAQNFPAAANFARIGMVMGHELSHGFDDQGRNFDGDGALRSWWTPSVSAEFAEKTQCLAAQYSTFPVVSMDDGHVLGTVNGNLTLGENIADNGGIHLAYEAYQLWKSTFAPPPIVPPTEGPTETPSPPAEAPASTPQPDAPEPEPTDINPGEQIPVVTLPPPVLPVPDAENPEPVQTEPSGEIPGATPSPPELVPEPEPTETGPGQVIPEETSPATQPPVPTETEPATQVPVVTPPPPPTVPTPPAVPGELTPPKVQTPEPSDATPSETKHKHKKEKDEPDDEEPSGKRKHHEDKETKSDKSASNEEGDESHKHSSDTHGKERGEEKGHHGAKDEEGKSSKRKHSKENDDSGEDKHHRHDEEESRKHKKHDEDQDGKSKRESDRHGGKERRHEDEEHEGKHRHEKREEEDHDRHNRREHDRHEERHRREEEESEEKGGRGDKHDDHDERGEEYGRHGKHGHHQEEEGERHGRHEDREERREERKDRHEEREKEHEEKRHRRDHEDREDGWDECGGCEREEHRRHNRHKHDEDWDEESERHGCGKEEEGGCGSKRHRYPFSGSDAKIHRMVERLARAIAQPSDPIADDRLFFTAFAQNWCEKRTPAYAELLRTIDPHSPGKWRVNGPLMNYNKFAEAFSCPLGTPMNPEKKCVIW